MAPINSICLLRPRLARFFPFLKKNKKYHAVRGWCKLSPSHPFSSFRAAQRPHSTGGPGVQVVDAPRTRGSLSRSSSVASVSAGAGDGGMSRGAGARSDYSNATVAQPPTLPSRTAAASADTDACAAPPAPMPQAPSYRTMMSVASSTASSTLPGAEPPTYAYASAGGASGGGGGGGLGGVDGVGGEGGGRDSAAPMR